MEGRLRAVSQAYCHRLDDVMVADTLRLGQKAPERPEEPVDDGKTLYEVRLPPLLVDEVFKLTSIEITECRGSFSLSVSISSKGFSKRMSVLISRQKRRQNGMRK